MTLHRSPVRRAVRQRSGHKVAGAGTGSTAKIVESNLYTPVDGIIRLKFSLPTATVPQLFLRDLGVIGAGFYVKTDSECQISMSFSWQNEDGSKGENNVENMQAKPEKWSRFGVLTELEIDDEAVVENLEFELVFETQNIIHLYGVMIGALSQEYYEANDIYKDFKIKTSLYIPEILYLNPEASDHETELLQGTDSGDGDVVILKSCNRCTRFLPIDLTDESNSLGYSRHHRDLQCTHSSFSRFEIEDNDTDYPELEDYIEDGFIKSFSGFQLECRPCKKMFVNKDLNPARDQTQHREDGIRRRAFEPLINALIPGTFTFRQFEIDNGVAFDTYIWEKFDQNCFNCGEPVSRDKKAERAKKMNLDHTRPLAFLWGIDESATSLCGTCNGSKLHKFPVEFYDEEKLAELAPLVGLSVEDLSAKKINEAVMDELINRIEWFFDEFLAIAEYQKIRKGKRASDLIVHALHNSIKVHNAHNENQYPVDLVSVYEERTGRAPETVETTN